jgi:predicted MFS family arabinose efflux permease
MQGWHTTFLGMRGLPQGVIVFFLQIDTLPQKNSSRDKHLQNRLSETPCAFGAD